MSSSSNQPLLGEQQGGPSSSRSPCDCRRPFNPTRCLGCTCIFLVLAILLFVAIFTSLGGFKAGDGNEDLPPSRLGNGTIRERHTGEFFPSKLSENGLKYGVLGATAWSDNLPLSLRVPISAIALYVEQGAARRKLASFKKKPEENNFDQALEKVLTRHNMRQMLVFKIVRTPASSRRVLNSWVSRFSPYLEKCVSIPGNVGDKICEDEEKAFIQAFEPLKFSKGGEFQLRREGRHNQENLYIRRKPLDDKAVRNANPKFEEDVDDNEEEPAYDFYQLRREEGGDDDEKALEADAIQLSRVLNEPEELARLDSQQVVGSEWVKVGKTACLARAVFEEKIHSLKNGLTNQLPHIYEEK